MPQALRDALSKNTTFAKLEMADPTEALNTLVSQLCDELRPRHDTPCEKTTSANWCVVHTIFGVLLAPESKCTSCGTERKPGVPVLPPFFQTTLECTSRGLRMRTMVDSDGTRRAHTSFDELLQVCIYVRVCVCVCVGGQVICVSLSYAS